MNTNRTVFVTTPAAVLRPPAITITVFRHVRAKRAGAG